MTASGQGTFSVHETANHDTKFRSGNPMVVYQSSKTGRAILDFFAPSGGYSTHLNPGITWTTTISIPGDWSKSSVGTIEGTHYLYGYDPEWTLTNDFTFDPATDQTLFKLVNTDYAGADSPHDGPFKNQDGFQGLLGMSPYHHVKDGTRYPAVLLTVGYNDPRVIAWQPGKMAARLQAATASNKPVLLRVDYDAGHGFGATKKQHELEMGDRFSFLWWQMGVSEFQPVASANIMVSVK